MTSARSDHVERAWARAGIHFNCTPAADSPDLERLIVETPRSLVTNARLYPLIATWLVQHGDFVAAHRLRRLVQEVNSPIDVAAIGLILDTALQHGAPRGLTIPLGACRPLQPPRAIFDVHLLHPTLAEIARQHATPLALRWGLWVSEVEFKPEAIRPVSFILKHNPEWRGRIIRKGDLRVSILESLRWDAGGSVRSEAELARLAGATRAAVRKALAALEQEGEVVIKPHAANRRDHAVELRAA